MLLLSLFKWDAEFLGLHTATIFKTVAFEIYPRTQKAFCFWQQLDISILTGIIKRMIENPTTKVWTEISENQLWRMIWITVGASGNIHHLQGFAEMSPKLPKLTHLGVLLPCMSNICLLVYSDSLKFAKKVCKIFCWKFRFVLIFWWIESEWRPRPTSEG